MKKVMKYTAALLLVLAGCSNKAVSSVPSSSSAELTGNVSISSAGFTDNQAETLMNAVISSHCAAAGVACKVTAVNVKGDDVVANYTYTKGEDTVNASCVLKGVTVNMEDPNQVSYESKSFADGAVDITPSQTEKDKTEAADSEKKDEENKENDEKDSKDELGFEVRKFDLPSKEPDPNEAGAYDTVTLVTEPGVRVYRIYVTRENFVSEGSYDGNGTFRVLLMDLNQKVESVAVEQKGPGEFNTVVPVTHGFHYMVLMTESGSWDLKWSAVPDDMVPHNN